MVLNIVVAYYNNKNYMKLFDIFDSISYNYKAIVYNKSASEIQLKNITVQPLENIGREGETYLTHIITNYDTLDDYTLFIQDDTNNHISKYSKFIDFCTRTMNSNMEFRMYPCIWKEKQVVVLRTIEDGICDLHTFPSQDAIKVACEYNTIDLPKKYTTETCAFFICHKNSILRHPKEFYVHLREWLLMDDKHGFVLEHMWKLIFSLRRGIF
jgi:hypothetical protein